MQITVTVTNPNPDTVWNLLAERLGRPPTNAEAHAEVKRILRDAREANNHPSKKD